MCFVLLMIQQSILFNANLFSVTFDNTSRELKCLSERFRHRNNINNCFI